MARVGKGKKGPAWVNEKEGSSGKSNNPIRGEMGSTPRVRAYHGRGSGIEVRKMKPGLSEGIFSGPPSDGHASGH